MTVKVYGLTSNNSIRKVRAYLEQNGITYAEQNMVSNPLSWEQLFEILMHTENGVEDILSTRSKDYKMLQEEGVDFDKLTLTEFHYIVKKHPKLLKSPIIVGKDTTIVGYNEAEIPMLGNRAEKRKTYLEVLNKIRLEEDKELGKLKTTKHDRAIAG